VGDTKVDERDTIAPGRLLAGRQNIGFSPDGNTIYDLSADDGHTCIYAQRLFPNRQPAGAPVVIHHLHEANNYGHPHGMQVGADKIVLLMNQGSSNIWLSTSARATTACPRRRPITCEAPTRSPSSRTRTEMDRSSRTGTSSLV
jgi:hypothetical protein